jgi:hypothetical protein
MTIAMGAGEDSRDGGKEGASVMIGPDGRVKEAYFSNSAFAAAQAE